MSSELAWSSSALAWWPASEATSLAWSVATDATCLLPCRPSWCLGPAVGGGVLDESRRRPRGLVDAEPPLRRAEADQVQPSRPKGQHQCSSSLQPDGLPGIAADLCPAHLRHLACPELLLMPRSTDDRSANPKGPSRSTKSTTSTKSTKSTDSTDRHRPHFLVRWASSYTTSVDSTSGGSLSEATDGQVGTFDPGRN